MWDSSAILRRHRFAAAFGVGGYAAGPVMLVAAMQGLPTVIFEPNAEPGFTNRVLADMATRIATGYPSVAERLGTPRRLHRLSGAAGIFRDRRRVAPVAAVSHPDHRRQPGRAGHQSRPGRSAADLLAPEKESLSHRAPDRRTRL